MRTPLYPARSQKLNAGLCNFARLAFGDRDDDLMNTDASQILSTLLMNATRVRLHETAPAGKRRKRAHRCSGTSKSRRR
jgi:hypothetical protein